MMKVKPSVTTKCMYDIFHRKKCITSTCVHNWNETHQRQEEELADIFTRTFKVARETKLQSFQFKLVHRIINCNKKIIRYENKSITSMFILWWNRWHQPFLLPLSQCATLVVFVLRDVEWSRIWPCKCSLLSNVYDILFGVNNMNDGHEVLNFCILHIKYYMYKQRLFNGNTMSLREIRNDIRYELDIEEKDMFKWR